MSTVRFSLMRLLARFFQLSAGLDLDLRYSGSSTVKKVEFDASKQRIGDTFFSFDLYCHTRSSACHFLPFMLFHLVLLALRSETRLSLRSRLTALIWCDCICSESSNDKNLSFSSSG